MFLKEFPDHMWLQQQAEKAFEQRLDVQGNKLPKEGWPIVIMNTNATFCHRPDLKGPFSIFTNISGESKVQVCNKRVTVSEDHFLITNRAQYYTLDIESTTPVETFNLHLGQDVWEDFTYASVTSPTKLLDNPFYSLTDGLCDFPNLLQAKNQHVTAALRQLQQLSQQPDQNRLQLQESLVPLFQALTAQKQDLARAVNQIPQLKACTRQELFKRISLATDFILSNLDTNVTLDELAALSCMSKFHFLRTFSSIYNTTPHRFILQHKVQRAQRLLSKTRASIGEVALLSGFEELSVFSRTFKKYAGYTPQTYRLLAN
jgi:AraC family transcriptional regulator